MSDAPALIDEHETLVTMLRNELAAAYGNDVMATISLRQLQILNALAPDMAGMADRIANVSAVATARQARRAGLEAHLSEVAGTPTTGEAVADMRLEVARQLQQAQTEQVGYDEKNNHPELYAVTQQEADEQVEIAREAGKGRVFPLTLSKITFDALNGRAWVEALNEWLTEHRDGPALPDNTNNRMAQPAVDALRTWLDATATEPAPADVAAQVKPLA